MNRRDEQNWSTFYASALAGGARAGKERDVNRAEIDSALMALGFAPPSCPHLRNVQAIVATEMGLHRCTVRVRLDGKRCVVEVPAEDVDEKRAHYAARAASQSFRCAEEAGADTIEIVKVAAS